MDSLRTLQSVPLRQRSGLFFVSKALARACVGPVYGSPHSLEDLLELLPKPFQFDDLIRHGVKLRPNQRAKPRTKSGMRASVERAHQRLELL
jgi:hypothetical protein